MDKEIAILFKQIIHPNDEIEFVPIKVIKGIYNKKENCFIDTEGTPYRHIIENPNSYGYCYRDTIANYKESHKHLTLSLIRALLLRTINKYTYTHNIDDETGAPIILFTNKKMPSEKNILTDEEIINIYTKHFPEYYNKYLNPNREKEQEVPETKEEIDIKKVYEEITSKIIDQDEVIRKTIGVLWKNNQGIKTSSKNIILDGPTGVGKSKICKLLVDHLDLPSIKISSIEGRMKQVELLILDLVKMAHGDIEKAQKGVIIIDKFEDFIMYSSSEGRGALETLLEDNKIIISSTAGEFLFDTSNLTIICLANTDKIVPNRKQVSGFSESEENKTYQEVLDNYFITLKLNPLNYNSYIKILNSEEGLLNRNITLLNSKGINLVISDNIKYQMAVLADSSKYKVKALERIIEHVLEQAEFEIEKNPEEYSELIVTEDTLKENHIYKLIRKK